MNRGGETNLARWRADPVAFIREVLRDPETGQPFVLYPAQERFLREALTAGPDGRLLYAELVYSCPKKSGKTGTAAMVLIYVVVVLGGRYAEAYCLANELEQSTGRVFQAVARIIEASPLLGNAAKITANKVEFPSTGTTITALASDYAGAAGSNPTVSCFDELWGYTSERSHRLWHTVPTRVVDADRSRRNEPLRSSLQPAGAVPSATTAVRPSSRGGPRHGTRSTPRRGRVHPARGRGHRAPRRGARAPRSAPRAVHAGAGPRGGGTRVEPALARVVMARPTPPHLCRRHAVDATWQTPLRLVLHRQVFKVARRPNRPRRARPLAGRAESGLATPVGGGEDADPGVAD